MIQQNNYKEASLSFDVDAQLIQELGERLVSRNHIGISELIKNAYDADSPDVQVSLHNVTDNDNKNSELIITDTGRGMDFETVSKFWMTIGTSNKRKNPYSEKYGRPVTGNKGIGRFACQRLAEYLELVTCAKTEQGYDHTSVRFEWEDFKPGQSLSRVECRYTYFSSPSGKPGTTLKLMKLRDRVTERDFKMLLKSITFISVAEQTKRRNYQEDPGFKATIDAPEFKSLIGKNQFNASDKLLSSGWGTLKGEISNGGNVEFTLDSKDSAKQVFSVANSIYSDLDGIKFTIHIVPLKGRDSIENRRSPTLLTKENLASIRDTYSGIKLYLNGFRVYPYGDVTEGDDWLGISRDIAKRRGATDFNELKDLAESMGLPTPSRAMLNHPGTRSLIGKIFVDGDATKAFEVKMDREGLVETSNFENLKKLIRMSLDWATLNYEAWLHRARNKKHKETERRFEQSLNETFEDNESRFKKAIETLEGYRRQREEESSSQVFKALPDDVSPQEKSTHLDQQKSLDRADEAEQRGTAREYALSQFEATSAENDLLRAVSATAPLLFIFAHEVKGISQTLLSHASELRFISKNLGSDTDFQKTLNEMADNAENYKASFDDLFELFDIFSDSSKTTNRRISYKNLFNRVKTGFRFFSKQFGIDLKFQDVNPTFQVPKLNQSEAYSILINLVSNSMKSLIASNVNKRTINVSLDRTNSQDCIRVNDNGIGLTEQHWEKVFEPKVFDPEGKLYSSISSKLNDEKLSNLGKGSGLGLNIVRNILNKHKGSIKFVPPQEEWKASVEVKLGR